MAKILVVDDSDYIRTYFCHVLGEEGYDLTGASSLQYVTALDVSKFDLAIIDILLDDDNGFEVADYLRAERGRIPILFVSGSHEPGYLLRSMKYAPCFFAYKPIVGRDLVDLVKAGLSGRYTGSNELEDLDHESTLEEALRVLEEVRELNRKMLEGKSSILQHLKNIFLA